MLLLFSCQVVSNSLRFHGLQHTRLPCPSPSGRICPNSCPLNWWYHPTISSSGITINTTCSKLLKSLGICGQRRSLKRLKQIKEIKSLLKLLNYSIHFSIFHICVESCLNWNSHFLYIRALNKIAQYSQCPCLSFRLYNRELASFAAQQYLSQRYRQR